MHYVLLIYASEEEYAKLSREQLGAIMQGHSMFATDVQQRNLLTGGHPLQSTHTATTVRLRNGKTMTTDGPFAETKEQLAGFYVLNCKDLDEAVALAIKIPDAQFGAIEIRPVMEISM